MITPTVRLIPALLCLLVGVRSSAQTVEQVIVSKGTQWAQLSAGLPVLDPTPLSPTHGGPFGFGVEVNGSDLQALPAPVVTLPAGSQVIVQQPFFHNGGTLLYNILEEAWNYGAPNGNNFGGTSEAGRDALFANGIYTVNLLGTSVSLNLAPPVFAPNVPQVTLTGGAWIGGKYFIDVSQPLTIASNAFTHYDKNANGVVILEVGELDSDDPAVRIIRSHAPTSLNLPVAPGANTIAHTIPARALTPGRAYNGEVIFVTILDQVAGAVGTALENSFNAALREQSTEFTIVPYACSLPQVAIHAVGDLAGGVARSTIRDVTRVGGVIYGVGGGTVGNGTTVDRAILWTSAGGLTALPDLAPNTSTSSIEAFAITPDGAYIASRAHASSVAADRRAVRVSTSTLQNLVLDVTTPNPQLSLVNAISDDGTILYGSATFTVGPGGAQVARFDANALTVTAIPFLNPGDNRSISPIRGASADGSVVVGTSASPSAPVVGSGAGNQAFRYVHGVGVSALPYAAGGTWNSALAVSPDGTLVLLRGNSSAAPNGEIYLYNVATAAITSLGSPNPGAPPSGNARMTADGRVVLAMFGTVSYVYNHTGWRTLSSVLAGAGLDLTGWNIVNFQGMSSDGTLICGNGSHNGVTEGYVIELPADFLASPRPVITSANTASATAGAVFAHTVTASNCAYDYDALNLPLGLAIDHATGVISGVPAQAGTFVITVTASNHYGVGVQELLLSIASANPPAITSLTASASALWPANHKLVPIALSATTSGGVGAVTVAIISVTSSEPDEGLGDGDTANDIQTTGPLTLQLRAERAAKGPGRTYTITVEARDAAGNASTQAVLVTVPRDQGK